MLRRKGASAPARPEKTPDPSLTIDVLVNDVLMDEIQACGVAWRDVARAKHDALDQDTIVAVALDLPTDAPEQSRARRRRQGSAAFTREIQEYIRYSVVFGQHTATMRIRGGDEAVSDAEADYQKRLKSTETDPVEVHADRAFLQVCDSYTVAELAEQKLRTKFTSWIGTRPNRLVDVANWLESDSAQPNGEHRPFFEFLARQEFDPYSGFLQSITEHWKGQPQALQSSFVRGLMAETQRDPSPDETNPDIDVGWIRFLPQLLGAFGVTDVSYEQIGNALQQLPVESLPPTISQRLSAEHSAQLDEVLHRLRIILEPYKHAGRFLTPELPASRYNSGVEIEAPAKKRNKRATPGKQAVRAVIEVEPTDVVSVVFTGSRTPEGYIATPLAETEAPAEQSTQEKLAAQLLGSALVKAHLAKYRNDRRLATDMEAMIQSILGAPRGDGIGKLASVGVSFPNPANGGGRKTFSIWHLNPNKRSQLSIGNMGRKTRIDFAMIPDGSGTEQLVLMDVYHKQERDEHRAGDFYA